MTELVSEERLKEVVYSVVGKYMNAAGGCNDELPRIGLMIARSVLEELKITKIQEVPWDSTCNGCNLQAPAERYCVWNCVCPTDGKGAVLVRMKDRIA